MRTRTEITLEMERWIVVNRPKKKCSACAQDAETMTIDDAALVAQVNSTPVSVEGLNDCEVHRNTDLQPETR